MLVMQSVKGYSTKFGLHDETLVRHYTSKLRPGLNLAPKSVCLAAKEEYTNHCGKYVTLEYVCLSKGLFPPVKLETRQSYIYQ